MNEIVKVLIVEDHPMMADGYQNILVNASVGEINITAVKNCEDAYKTITSAIIPFDIVLLDMNLPKYELEKLYSGEDIAVIIRKQWPETKIIFLTSHTEAILLFNLLKKINPESLMIKSDFTPEEFLIAYNKVSEGETYYTKTAKQCLKDVYVDNNYLDAYNRRIISLLAKGVSTKNLPSHLKITISAIDKRKAQIKDIFNIKKGTDDDIINEAKKRGLV